MIRNVLLYHLASGHAFFSGSALIVAAVLLAAVSQRRWNAWCVRLAFILGVILVTLSVTPLPVWIYVVLAAVSLAWIVSRASSRIPRRWRTAITVATVLVWSIAVCRELPHHRLPILQPIADPVIGVLGDSVTAGMNDRGPPTWPRIVAEERGLTIHDCSQPGATAASALRQAAELHGDENLLILEIGGNDLLSSAPVADFERDLDALLSDVCQPGRTVVMLELPLLPFSHGYGRAQRRLCEQHGVLLIPKRVLLGVLLTGGATIDSIHLTAEGQRQMAEEVGMLIAPVWDGKAHGPSSP